MKKDSSTVPVINASSEEAPASEKHKESINTKAKTPGKIVSPPETASSKPAETKASSPEE
jgi:hypothetical protein